MKRFQPLIYAHGTSCRNNISILDRLCNIICFLMHNTDQQLIALLYLETYIFAELRYIIKLLGTNNISRKLALKHTLIFCSLFTTIILAPTQFYTYYFYYNRVSNIYSIIHNRRSPCIYPQQ